MQVLWTRPLWLSFADNHLAQAKNCKENILLIYFSIENLGGILLILSPYQRWDAAHTEY
jgi:hypothetical protein